MLFGSSFSTACAWLSCICCCSGILEVDHDQASEGRGTSIGDPERGGLHTVPIFDDSRSRTSPFSYHGGAVSSDEEERVIYSARPPVNNYGSIQGQPNSHDY